MNGMGPAATREERHRKRVRIVMVEIRRCFLTAMKAIEQFEAQEAADDADLPTGAVPILPGHSADLPHNRTRPPRMN